MVRIETAAAAGGWRPALREGRPLDDQGYHVGVFQLKTDRRGRHHYGARWYTPYLGPSPAHRIVIAPNSGQPELTSDPFG